MSDTYNHNTDLMEENANHFFEASGIECFSERLKKTIGDISIRSFAKKCELSEGVMRNYLAGKTYPSLDKLALMAEAGGKSLEWLCTGNNTGSLEVKENTLSNEFALIPGYRVQVSAGHGTVTIDDGEPVRYLAFRRKWLKWRGFNERGLAIVWAKGDSMEPTINSNDTLVVHLGRTVPQDGHIYIFRNEQELFVKRYQSMVGFWRLKSDNQLYDAMDIKKEDQHQFQVIGQVVHIAKDIGN